MKTSLVLRTLDTRDPGFDAALDTLIAFEAAQDPAIDAAVAAIIDDVRARGDAAVLEYTARFDDLRVSSISALTIDARAMRDAYQALPHEQRAALDVAARRIRDFHERQRGGGFGFLGFAGPCREKAPCGA